MSTKKSADARASGFGERLKQACNSTETADIARKIGVPYQTARNYLRGRLPAADVLVVISNLTNVSIHWLLTGEGPQRVDEMFTAEQPALYGPEDLDDAVQEVFAEALRIYSGKRKQIAERQSREKAS